MQPSLPAPAIVDQVLVNPCNPSRLGLVLQVCTSLSLYVCVFMCMCVLSLCGVLVCITVKLHKLVNVTTFQLCLVQPICVWINGCQLAFPLNLS